MTELLDRIVPDEPRPRFAVALAGATVGLPALVYGVFPLTWPIQRWFYFGRVASVAVLLLGVFALVGARALARDVSERVDDTGTDSDSPSSEASEDPVAALKRGYAESELTEEQFERKLERLVELDVTEGPGDTGADDLLVETE